VQVTPHNSEASIIFGKGVTSAKPGSAHSLVLGVNDIDTARDDLVARGVDVSEVFHYAGGPFNNGMENPVSAGATLRNVPASRLPRSRTRTGTVGCCKRSRNDFPAANGN
jgi:hypothetical protein